MTQLVLSLFPGIGLLDSAFGQEGFCVVCGPDVLWGGDIRRFHPTAKRFNGVIGGPPCQTFSPLANIVRAKGYEPEFGNLIPEFERCVMEAEPEWFVMENVPQAPVPAVDGYGVHSFCLNNRQLGEQQNRVRRWSFGWRGGRRVLKVETRVFEHPDYEYAACGGSTERTTMANGVSLQQHREYKRTGRLPVNTKSVRAFKDLCALQGLPDGFDLPAFTVRGKCQAVGNGVPMAMGRAIAAAVKKALTTEACWGPPRSGSLR